MLKNVLILGGSSLVSRLLGVLRDSLFARIFGAGGVGIFNLDVYYGAFKIPDLIYGILISGAVGTAFIPVLAMIRKGKDFDSVESDFVSNTINIFCVFTFIFVIFAFIFAPLLVDFLVPGFSEESKVLTVEATRIMLLSPFFFSISSFFQAYQNASNSFFYYALAPIIYNLSIIFSAYFFAEDYGIIALAYGVVVGSISHFLIQIPALFKLGFKYRFRFDVFNMYFKKLLHLFTPRIFSASIFQITQVFDVIIASLLTAGSITVLSYAFNLSSLPMGIIGVSFAVASFASFSEVGARVMANQSDKKLKIEFSNKLSSSLQTMYFFLIPSLVGLFVLRDFIIELILNNDNLPMEFSTQISQTLLMYIPGVIATGTIPMLSRAFYCIHNSKTPVVLSVIMMILNLGMNYYLAIILGYGTFGIALASSTTAIFGLLLYLYFLFRQSLFSLSIKQIVGFGYIFGGSLIMGVILSFVIQFINFYELSTVLQLIILCFLTYLGAIFYYLLTKTRHFDESLSLRKILFFNFVR